MKKVTKFRLIFTALSKGNAEDYFTLNPPKNFMRSNASRDYHTINYSLFINDEAIETISILDRESDGTAKFIHFKSKEPGKYKFISPKEGIEIIQHWSDKLEKLNNFT